MLKDNTRGYGLVTIALHWLSALTVLFLFGLGIYMVDLGYYDDWYHEAPALHISIGLLLLVVMSFRLLWRIFSRSPAPLPNYSLPVRLASTAVKIVLYALIFSVLISGYLITSADGRGPLLFDWFRFPVLIQLSADSTDLAGWIHEVFAWLIIIFAALHALAALVHHFVIRDRTLVRMLKPVSKPQD
ncbi:MAG TPA: cytochrome b [Cellvibrionaceae bacterium]